MSNSHQRLKKLKRSAAFAMSAVGMVIAAVLVVMSVPLKSKAGTLLQQGSMRAGSSSKGRQVAEMLVTQLEELKALPIAHAFSSSLKEKRLENMSRQSKHPASVKVDVRKDRTQILTEAPAEKKPCDTECEHMKDVGKQRMKELRDQIEKDFTGMTTFGAEAAYVPPVESIEKQVADGSLNKDPTADLKPPPDNFAGSSLIAADPGAAAPVLSSGQVKSVAQVVSTETPSAQDLLKHIQEAEASAVADAKAVRLASPEAVSRSLGSCFTSSFCAQSTCFTSTKVQILMEICQRQRRRASASQTACWHHFRQRGSSSSRGGGLASDFTCNFTCNFTWCR